MIELPDILATERTPSNDSESHIRGELKWRKISGGTRRTLGWRCRITFASLKMTCRKLGISLWDYLNGRIEQTGTILPLPNIVRERAPGAVVP